MIVLAHWRSSAHATSVRGRCGRVESEVEEMTRTEVTVFVVDDEELVRIALTRQLRSAGWRTQAYGSGREFLGGYSPDVSGCILLDVNLPDQSGLELYETLTGSGCSLPVIFLTGYGDIDMGVQAMKSGAFDFLTKPWQEARLLDTVKEAVQVSQRSQQYRDEVGETRHAFAKLTPREQEVCQLVATGLLNKQVAYQLGVTEKTVKVHRARVMRKMGVESLAELVHLVEQMGLGLARTKDPQ